MVKIVFECDKNIFNASHLSVQMYSTKVKRTETCFELNKAQIF